MKLVFLAKRVGFSPTIHLVLSDPPLSALVQKYSALSRTQIAPTFSIIHFCSVRDRRSRRAFIAYAIGIKEHCNWGHKPFFAVKDFTSRRLLNVCKTKLTKLYFKVKVLLNEILYGIFNTIAKTAKII